MKNVGVLLFCFALFGSCQNAPIEKPDNLIDQDKMVDIMFDINVLEAMKSQTTLVLEANKINPNGARYFKAAEDGRIQEKPGHHFGKHVSPKFGNAA